MDVSNYEELNEETSPNIETETGTDNLEVQENEIAQEIKVVDDTEPPQYETIETENLDDDARSLNQEEVSSQMSDDQDESTVINNENYDNNNDSAYETNEINSHNGSDSRLQSADTNEGDETEENLLIQNEIEVIERQQSENLEIERLENDLENPPTPIDDDDYDVVVSAVNSTETGNSTVINDDEVGKEEVH